MIFGKRNIGTLAYMGGVPCNLESFTWSWGQLIAHSLDACCEPNETLYLAKATVSHHATARNDLSERFKGDWLFMLDMDHQFEPDLLARLLHRANTYNMDVAVGVYHFKQPPHPPLLYGWRSLDSGEGFALLGDWDDSQIQTIAGAGGGCLLIRRSVFDRIRDELGEKPFDPIGGGGEDLSFFMRLRKLGINAWFDPRVECPHLRVAQVTSADFERTRDTPAPDAEGIKVA